MQSFPFDIPLPLACTRSLRPSCSLRTATDELYAIDTTGSQAGSTLLIERTKDTILSLAVLLKAKFKVDFAVGTEEDPSLEELCGHPKVILLI